MRRILLASGRFAIAVALGSAAPVQASLIGDTVHFECTNCGPATSDDFIVLGGTGPELTLFDQIEVDVEDSYLLVRWIVTGSSVISDINFIWSDLDWAGPPGAIVSVEIDPSSTWATGPPATIAFGSDFVSVTNNGDSSVVTGDFLRINLNPVPEPGSLPLLVFGLVGIAAWRKRSTH